MKIKKIAEDEENFNSAKLCWKCEERFVQTEHIPAFDKECTANDKEDEENFNSAKLCWKCEERFVQTEHIPAFDKECTATKSC